MNDIETFLRQNKPSGPDEGQFLIETNARLDAVEGIKQDVDRERRHGRKALVIALVAGLVGGCAATLLLTLYPAAPVPSGEFSLEGILAALQDGKNWFLVLAGLCAFSLAVILVSRRSVSVSHFSDRL